MDGKETEEKRGSGVGRVEEEEEKWEKEKKKRKMRLGRRKWGVGVLLTRKDLEGGGMGEEILGGSGGGRCGMRKRKKSG